VTSTIHITGADALADFRVNNNGSVIISKVNQHKSMLVNWSVGVGKSNNMDQVISTAIADDHYDLVIALMPTRALIDEREFIRNQPENIKIINIKPRPVDLCGDTRNRDWGRYETKGLSFLGKIRICKNCPDYQECFWPEQYGEKLAGSRAVFATQAHLKNNPDFIEYIKKKTKAKKALVIFDEANISLTPYSRSITIEQLSQLIYAIHESTIKDHQKQSWGLLLNSLIQATTDDLRVTNAWQIPPLYPMEILEIQRLGDRAFGSEYSDITYDLKAFSQSPHGSREKLDNGDMKFSASPLFGNNDVLLYSGTTDPKILKLRFGTDFVVPYKDYQFKGENTQWFNIASSIGATKNFLKNSPQILDFFTELILQRTKLNKRILLITKKKLTSFCIEKLNELLTLNESKHRVVTGNECNINNHNEIPIIHYGVIGINKFEHFDCVFCLNSYYISPEILSDSIQDIRASDDRIELEINMTHSPRRRHAQVVNDQYRYTDVASVANSTLKVMEMGTVIQAIGRVRPFTNSREIITFQNSEPHNYTYDEEFDNLDGARLYFGINSSRTRKVKKLYYEIQEHKSQKIKQKDVADLLQVSIRTVRRYWATTKVDDNP